MICMSLLYISHEFPLKRLGFLPCQICQMGKALLEDVHLPTSWIFGCFGYHSNHCSNLRSCPAPIGACVHFKRVLIGWLGLVEVKIGQGQIHFFTGVSTIHSSGARINGDLSKDLTSTPLSLENVPNPKSSQ